MPQGAPGAVTRHNIEGIVSTHVRSGRAGVDYILTLQRPERVDAKFTYRLGRHRRLPVNTGDSIRIVVAHRAHAADEGEDVGVLIYRSETESVTDNRGDSPLKAPRGPGDKPETGTLKLRNRAVLIAVVEQNQLFSEDELPAALRGLRITDVAAYKEAGRYRADCQDVREQRYFRLSRPDLLAGSEGKILRGRFFAPGSRLRMRQSTTESFDVVLLSHVAVVRSSCRAKPDAVWSWAAIRSEKADTK
ncbi:MAG: hypothetical protein KC502_20025 [Myxococcales bacterium]|nr:hypothetical protein [Myxococcales bacterium]